jgi:hypothetical protein
MLGRPAGCNIRYHVDRWREGSIPPVPNLNTAWGQERPLVAYLHAVPRRPCLRFHGISARGSTAPTSTAPLVNATKLTSRPLSTKVVLPRLWSSEHQAPVDIGVRGRVDSEVSAYIEGVLDGSGGTSARTATWVSSVQPEDLRGLQNASCSSLVNIATVNNLRWINRFFRAANACLPTGGLYVCCVETLGQRWDRVFRKYSAPIAHLFYFLTFVFNRVIPKLPLTRRLYFRMTEGKNRVISEAEVLGRLICCGFEIVDSKEIGGYLYVVARKVAVTMPAVNPSYGPLFRATRIGMGGRKIQVLKLRTMHPYSEYVQEYVFERNSLAEGGKFRDDFRITGWGRLCRRYWIDELPMLINWVKGDLKLVGVRPLSSHYADLYPEALRSKRQQTKPGLIPPFYADLPITFEEILASEERYLASFERQPFLTDLRYFWLALKNIVFRRARSA